MNVLILLAHPERASLNGGLVDIAAETMKNAGHDIQIDDLYREGFDPVERPSCYSRRADETYFSALTEQRAHYKSGALPSDIQREIARLEWADLVIFQFPLWWHAQPAILKGWFDRVLVYGGIYSGQMRYDHGYFKGKRAICSVTTGSPEQAFRPFGRAGNIVEWLWPIHSSLYYVGYDVLAPQVSYGIQAGGICYQDETSFRDQLGRTKQDWASRLQKLENEQAIPFTGWDDWDDAGVLCHSHPIRWRP